MVPWGCIYGFASRESTDDNVTLRSLECMDQGRGCETPV